MQLEELECGAAALTMVAAYYDKWVPLEQMRVDCGVSRDGSSAKNIIKAADKHGFTAKAYRRSLGVLREKGQFPCIVYWNYNHFIVLNGFRGKNVYVNDPARGFITMSIDEFEDGYTGITINPIPNENFVPGGQKKKALEFIKKSLKGQHQAVALVMLTTVFGYLFGIINPVMTQIFTDRIITGKNREWIMPFLGILVLIGILQLIVSWTQTIYSLKLNGKMSVVGSSSFMWKVLHLPMEFFSQRMAGDIQSRMGMNASIAQTLANTLSPLLLNTIMMFFYLFVMLRYSVILTIVGIVSVLLNLVLSQMLAKKRMNLMRSQMRDSARSSSTAVAGIEQIETLKASGAERGFFRRWSGLQASMNAQSIKFQRTENIFSVATEFISMITNYTVYFLGIWFAMQGNFTIGMLTAFQGFLGSFMSPAITLVSAGQTIQTMRTQVERVDDVMEYPDDPNAVDNDDLIDDGGKTKLKGMVELKNITFGYSRLADPLIEDFSMTLKPGQRVAFVGTSGCGKSTLSKLISGLYDPWSGEILFDGKKRSEIRRSVMTGSLAVVDQDIILFEDTIANNIKMWDQSIKDFDMILAAKDAQIHEEILFRENSYESIIRSGGRNLSGGQRQRLEIARVLAQDPSIVILDEATSALDAKTEYELVKAIKSRGITCIIIAHRLSTIRDCDEIVVLDKGHVVERGTHDQLMELNGVYAELISEE
ncbi:MAG: NHLP family bacteriocin export ABC transporter peptidase/permease/ATPase subunit [Clostridiales bacterium]|nr:NHLP family bacteriocin export ABC transporter peptidase/permease/ATPase subunit [Clostridiales bacterium]